MLRVPVATGGEGEMGRRHSAVGLVVGILLSGVGQASAQSPIGVVEKPDVEIRTAPPHGPLNLLRGEPVETDLTRGDCVVILSERSFNGFRGAHVWYEIGPVGEDSDVGQGWWLYAGVKNAVGQTPFIRIDQTAGSGNSQCTENGS